jgi:hypothetical protein
MTGMARLGAASAILAGGLRMAASVIPYDGRSLALQGFYALIDLGLLFGLLAVRDHASARLGGMGQGACLIALGGLASIVGPDSTQFGVDWYLAGAGVFLAGLGGLAISLLRAGVLVAAAVTWLAALAAGVLAAASPLALAVSGALLGAGFLLAGATLWRAGGEASAHLPPMP